MASPCLSVWFTILPQFGSISNVLVLLMFGYECFTSCSYWPNDFLAVKIIALPKKNHTKKCSDKLYCVYTNIHHLLIDKDFSECRNISSFTMCYFLYLSSKDLSNILVRVLHFYSYFFIININAFCNKSSNGDSLGSCKPQI